VKDFDKVSVMLGTLACQVHIVTMALGPGFGDTLTSDGDTVLAFTIIALLLLLGAEILLIEIHYIDLKGHRIAKIITILCFWTAAACVIVALSVYGSYKSTDTEVAYLYTTYVVGAAAAIAAGIFMLLSVRAK